MTILTIGYETPWQNPPVVFDHVSTTTGLLPDTNVVGNWNLSVAANTDLPNTNSSFSVVNTNPAEYSSIAVFVSTQDVVNPGTWQQTMTLTSWQEGWRAYMTLYVDPEFNALDSAHTYINAGPTQIFDAGTFTFPGASPAGYPCDLCSTLEVLLIEQNPVAVPIADVGIVPLWVAALALGMLVLHRRRWA